MLSAMPRRYELLPVVLAVVALGGCERRQLCNAPDCGTLVDAAIGEPGTLLPASTEEITARDVEEQLFLKLADVGMSMNTIGDEDFQPLLAQKWEWDGPLTLVFHIDPRARWHDGQPVTAVDVAFTYDAYSDSTVASPYRAQLKRLASVTARDSLTAVFRFRERYPEMFYDAVYHMRVLPAHLLRSVPREQWKTAAFGRQPVGDGPYRFVSWQAGQAIELRSDPTFVPGPPGPMSSLLWSWDPELRQLSYDTAQAARILNARGWRDHDGDGVRDRDGQPLAFRILVPSTSVLRRQYAQLLQEQYRVIGVHVEIDALDPGALQQRISSGRFDSAILSRSNDPSPSSGITQTWTRGGIGGSNYTRYSSPEFDRLVDRAIAAASRDQARQLWRAAMETINADAPAIFLYSLDNVAGIHRRVADVQIRPDSWAALLRTWRIPPDQQIDRDRVER